MKHPCTCAAACTVRRARVLWAGATSLSVPACVIRRAAVLWAGAAALSVAGAAEYSWQVAGGYEDIDSDVAMESSVSSVRATWYTSAVDDQVGPWELAPFLNRSSFVSVGTTRSKMREQLYPSLYPRIGGRFPSIGGDGIVVVGTAPDEPPGGAPDDFGTRPDYFGTRFASPLLIGIPAETGVDSSGFAVDGRYVWPGAGWYAGARAQRSDADVVPDWLFGQTPTDHEGAGVFAGRYFGPRTALELGFGTDTLSQELRASPFAFDPFFGVPDLSEPPGEVGLPGYPGPVPIELHTGTETETETVRLSVRHVGDLGDSTFHLGASLSSSRTETRLFLPSPPDFFYSFGPFDPTDRRFITTSPGDLVLFDFLESGRERQYSLSGTLYPTPALGVSLTFTNTDDDALGTSDLVGLSANWFFLRNAALEVELTRESPGSGQRYGLPDTDALGVRLLGRF